MMKYCAGVPYVILRTSVHKAQSDQPSPFPNIASPVILEMFC